MASSSNTISTRRSERLAGLAPQNSPNGATIQSRNSVHSQRPSASTSSTTTTAHLARNDRNVNSGRCNRRSCRRRRWSRVLKQKSRVESSMVSYRRTPTTSDSSSQTTEPSTSFEQPVPVDRRNRQLEQQPSTSRQDSTNMGSALGSSRNDDSSAADGQEARGCRRRRRRHARRALIEVYRGIPSSMPVKGESYCDCPKQGRDLTCTCGEEDNVFEWCWDTNNKSAACDLSDDSRMSIFHMSYSSGTAAVRGTQSMTDRQYFWEVKMTSPVYGTDMMVGVGTINVNLGAFRHAFTSLLGRDGESWGLSYYGRKQHKGQFKDLKGGKFGQGTILGVHVDMWHGTVSYYKNRRPLGVSYRGLAGKALFPMVASTAARTAMKVIKARSFQTSLQFLCCQVLRKLIPSEKNVIDALDFPPGLRAFLENNLSWLLRPSELASDNRVKRRRRSCSKGSSSESSSSEDDSDAEGPQAKRIRLDLSLSDDSAEDETS